MFGERNGYHRISDANGRRSRSPRTTLPRCAYAAGGADRGRPYGVRRSRIRRLRGVRRSESDVSRYQLYQFEGEGDERLMALDFEEVVLVTV